MDTESELESQESEDTNEEIFDMPTSCMDHPFADEMICDGHKVILKKDKFYKIVTVRSDKLEQCEKRKFRLNGAIGKPYESLFLIQDDDLIHLRDRQHYEDFENHYTCEEIGKEISDTKPKDNRNLISCPSNQTLQPEDISQMRADGKTGEEIVTQLIENSSSFSDKTVFSKAKYLKKKKKKHMEVVTILRPNTRNLCEMYSLRGIQKILGLRIDTVSYMLSHANVHSGVNVLMHETCAGLMLGAVLERLGAEGRLLHFHHGSAPPRPESHACLSPEALRLLIDIPLQEATALRLTCNYAIHSVGDGPASKKRRLRVAANNGSKVDSTGEIEVEGETKLKEKEDVVPNTVSKDLMVFEKSVEKEGGKEQQGTTGDISLTPKDRRKGSKRELTEEEQEQRRIERRKRLAHARTALIYEPWNSLIVATKFHPTVPVLTLLHFLSPGAPFVVYCQRMDPLVKLLDCLKRRGEVAMLELTEGWFRPFQVLPDRTHPEMTMQGGAGGYVLSGFKTCGPYGKMRTAEADYQEGILQPE